MLSTVSDRLNPIADASGSLVAYYQPDITSATDYYPGGMQMPGRNSASSTYRYGFGGQEKSNEIKGEGNSYTAMFWEYDPRLVRRWNVDPRGGSGISSYAAFSNNPILNTDPLGDTPRVVLEANGQPTGELGQRFNFINDGSIDKDQFNKMKEGFLGNLEKQVSGRSYGGNNVSLNTNDPLASVIDVTFGAAGTSNASMENNTIYISATDMPNSNNTATHEWLHTAGLMDRNIDIYGYNTSSSGITINGQRTANIPMANMPPGYDPDYNPDLNIMSAGGKAAGTQITNQQFSILFSGPFVSERAGGGLGLVSALIRNPFDYATGQWGAAPNQTQIRSATAGLNRMAFTGTSAIQMTTTTTTTLSFNNFIIHTLKGNIYPPNGFSDPVLNRKTSKPALDAFRR